MSETKLVSMNHTFKYEIWSHICLKTIHLCMKSYIYVWIRHIGISDARSCEHLFLLLWVGCNRLVSVDRDVKCVEKPLDRTSEPHFSLSWLQIPTKYKNSLRADDRPGCYRTVRWLASTVCLISLSPPWHCGQLFSAILRTLVTFQSSIAHYKFRGVR